MTNLKRHVLYFSSLFVGLRRFFASAGARLWTAWLGGMVGVSIAGFVSPTLHSCQDTDIDGNGEDEEIHTEAL